MPAEPSVQRRVVALTGAGGSLGLLITQALLRRGDIVIANHRSPSPGLRSLAVSFPNSLHPLLGDVGDETTARQIVTAATEIGRLDALVLNAAITRDRALVRMSVQDWDDVVRVNLRGPFLATKHALRFMMRQKYGLNGTVVHGHDGIAY